MLLPRILPGITGLFCMLLLLDWADLLQQSDAFVSVSLPKITIFLNFPLTAASSRPSGRQYVTGRLDGSHTTTPPSVEKKIPRVALTSRFLAVQWGHPARRSLMMLLCCPLFTFSVIVVSWYLEALSQPTPNCWKSMLNRALVLRQMFSGLINGSSPPVRATGRYRLCNYSSPMFSYGPCWCDTNWRFISLKLSSKN